MLGAVVLGAVVRWCCGAVVGRCRCVGDFRLGRSVGRWVGGVGGIDYVGGLGGIRWPFWVIVILLIKSSLEIPLFSSSLKFAKP